LTLLKILDDLASQADELEDVYMVNAFSGLYAPYWRSDARGLIIGLTDRTTKKEICKAALDAVAFMTREVLDCTLADAGHSAQLTVLKVDGGMSSSRYLLQRVSDLVRRKVVRPECVETTALGAAFAAGLSTGFWASPEDIHNRIGKRVTEFTPLISEEYADSHIRGWKRAVQRSLGWVVKPNPISDPKRTAFRLPRHLRSLLTGVLIGSVVTGIVLSRKR